MSTIIPDEIREQANKLFNKDITIHLLPYDASSRRYYRLIDNKKSFVLMDSRLEKQTMKDFVNVDNILNRHEVRVPKILEVNYEKGFILLEDFGDNRVDLYLDQHPQMTQQIYTHVVDLLGEKIFHINNPSIPIFDDQFFFHELDYFVDWYPKLLNLKANIERKSFQLSWQNSLKYLHDNDTNNTFVHKDLHVANVFWLSNKGRQPIGLIDFQNAKSGSATYDITSLLFDCRRPMNNYLRNKLLDRYCEHIKWDKENFTTISAIYIAQRNIKILGNFANLYLSKKLDYLNLIPNVWENINNAFNHPILLDVKSWFVTNNILNQSPIRSKSNI